MWLNLANAYGSVPYKLVEEALRRYHVPIYARNFVQDYYDDFSIKTPYDLISSDWHPLEKGIIIGCTISVILFNAIIVGKISESWVSRMRNGV